MHPVVIIAKTAHPNNIKQRIEFELITSRESLRRKMISIGSNDSCYRGNIVSGEWLSNSIDTHEYTWPKAESPFPLYEALQ